HQFVDFAELCPLRILDGRTHERTGRQQHLALTAFPCWAYPALSSVRLAGEPGLVSNRLPPTCRSSPGKGNRERYLPRPCFAGLSACHPWSHWSCMPHASSSLKLTPPGACS